MNLEDIMQLSGINQIQKDIIVLLFYIYKVPGVVKFIQTEGRMVVARGEGKGRMGSFCLMITEFQFRR